MITASSSPTNKDNATNIKRCDLCRELGPIWQNVIVNDRCSFPRHLISCLGVCKSCARRLEREDREALKQMYQATKELYALNASEVRGVA